MIDPRIHYVTIRNAILTLLRANLATLNTDLSVKTFTSGTTQIIPGNPEKRPIMNVLYPVIMVEPISKSEDWEQISSNGKKYPQTTFRIYGVVFDMENPHSNEDIYYLADNIEAVFRDNIDINGNVLYSNPSDMEFGFIFNQQNETYCDAVKLDLSCTTEVR